jgi:hypothetical protein
MNPNSTKNYQFLKTLDGLDFIPVESTAEIVLYNSIKESLQEIGIAYSKAVIDHICKFSGLSEREILTNCDIFEDSMYRIFGHGAISIINRVKATALRIAVTENKSDLTVPQILDPSLTLDDILREIRSIEALDFINKMAPYNHLALLYSREDSLTKILAEYFGPKDTPKVLLSENPGKYSRIALSGTISYGELFGTVSDRIETDKGGRIQDWLSQVRIRSIHPNSNVPARFAIDDATWWIRNGFTRGLTLLEQSLCKKLPNNTSILCAFDISKLNPKQLGTIKSIMRYHDYVIIEEPAFAVYKLNKPHHRNE